jgi:hypothetical protein
VRLAFELSRHLDNRRDSEEVDQAETENFRYDKVLTTLRIFAVVCHKCSHGRIEIVARRAEQRREFAQ